MEWLDEIISLYLLVCEHYQNELKYYCERHSNYADLRFTDEEVITIYMYATKQGLLTKKQIHKQAINYWHDLFPNIPQYEGFVHRVNLLSETFLAFTNKILSSVPQEKLSDDKFRLGDSFPIIMAKMGRRFTAKVAPELADANGYCATKKLYYYGVKLHVIGCAQSGTIPIPEQIGVTAAGTADITAYEQVLPEILHKQKFCDKAYYSGELNSTNTFTPIKKDKGQAYLDAADALYSTAISKIRQPIESLFNWVEEKVHLQIASKVITS